MSISEANRKFLREAVEVLIDGLMETEGLSPDEAVREIHDVSREIAEPLYAKTALQPVKFPEHEKLHLISDKSQCIGDFVAWLRRRDAVLARWEGNKLYPEGSPITKLLADFFEIDLEKIEAEKRAMLDELRSKLREG